MPALSPDEASKRPTTSVARINIEDDESRSHAPGSVPQTRACFNFHAHTEVRLARYCLDMRKCAVIRTQALIHPVTWSRLAYADATAQCADR